MRPIIAKKNWRLNFAREDRKRLDLMRGKDGRLCKARRRKGLSQAEAAALAGVTQSAISRAEASGDVNFLLLERLSYIYGVGLREFATAGEEMQNSYQARSIEEWLVLIRADKHLVTGFDLYFAEANIPRHLRNWEVRGKYKDMYENLPPEIELKWQRRATALNLGYTPETPEEDHE
jgi:transcriptional regulator with XRE-family HTH domain